LKSKKGQGAVSTESHPAADRGRTVIAVGTTSGTAGPYRAVVLQRRAGGIVLAEWRTQEAGTSLAAVVDELRRRYQSPQSPDEDVRVVVAIDSTAVGFYRLELPAVDPEQLSNLVHMQAEALLPLSPDEMALAWTVTVAEDDQRVCTLAAVRKRWLGELAQPTGPLASAIVIPDCQGLVRAWRSCVSGDRRKAALLHVRPTDTRVVFTENGRLVQAATIDLGAEELAEAEGADNPAALFVHDIRNALQRLDSDAAATGRVFLLAPEAALAQRLIEGLGRAGIMTKPVPWQGLATLLPGSATTAEEDQSPEALLPYAEAIGAGLLILDNEPGLLNLVEPAPTKATDGLARALVRTGLAAVAAVLMLGLWLFTAKTLDRAELERLQNSKLGQLVAYYQTREQIYEQRPDLLDVLDKLKASMPDGMLVDSFVFQKGRPIQITLSAANRAQVFQFQEKLAAQSGISDVQILGTTLNTSRNRVQSKATFHYLWHTKNK